MYINFSFFIFVPIAVGILLFNYLLLSQRFHRVRNRRFDSLETYRY